MKNELISVIVPIYKVEKYLKRCVKSIENQTYRNLEIILVDDGSPDRCGEICDQLMHEDFRIRVIHKKNGGLADARNAGIEVASGQYLAFIDSDDYISRDMMEKLYSVLVDTDADMSLCGFFYVDEKCNPIADRNKNAPIVTEVISGETAILKLMRTKGYYYTIAWNKLYKKKLFDTIRFPYGRIHEDEFVSHLVFGECKKVACISDPLYFYVQREDSIMGQTVRKKSIKDFDLIDAFVERAMYCKKLGLTDAVRYFYFVAAMRFSKMVSIIQGSSKSDNIKFMETKKKFRKGVRLTCFCSKREKIHIFLVLIDPRFHRFLVEVLKKK